MKFAEYILARLESFDLPTKIDSDTRREREFLLVTVNGEEKRIRIEPDWEDAYASYNKARSRKFDIEDLSFTLNNSMAFPLVRLNVEGIREASDKFLDAKGNTVEIARASMLYSLAHFDSSAYEAYFNSLVRGRLERANPRLSRSINVLFRSPITATYIAKGKKTPASFKKIAIERIQACLVKMAVERDSCYEFWKLRSRKSAEYLGEIHGADTDIPDVSYEKNVTNFYMVARSSPFPSQSFLAYYHVLEYYFLKVAEDALHYQLRALINKTTFKSNTDGIDKVISLVRKQANQDNETEMLRKVLQRFVSEADFIEYINSIETEYGEKLYTKQRLIFGEKMNISLTEGHALSNAANVLKHVRNAIVHSSDRYKREECHIPLSETEDVIGEFIPVVRFFAEKVIFGTAAPQD